MRRHTLTLLLSLTVSAAVAQTLTYLGPSGTYSDAAAQQVAVPKGWTTAQASTITEVSNLVGTQKTQYGLLPIENSSGGYVAETSTILSKSQNWRIVGSVNLPIDNTLLVRPGTKASDITTIVSHPQPFLQSAAYLKTNYPNATRIEAKSTAAAAEQVSKLTTLNTAAISAPAAAKVYGLVPLAERIQDDKTNTTRFWVITSEPFNPASQVNRAVVSFVPRSSDSGLGLDRVLTNMRRLGLRPTGILSTPAGTVGEQRMTLMFSSIRSNAVADIQQALSSSLGDTTLLGAFQE